MSIHDRVLLSNRTENLSCQLTHEQWLERVRERSAVETEIEERLRAISDLKHRQKEELGRLEKELADVQGKERTLATAVRTHTEIRPVDCSLLADLVEKKAITVRLDTGADVYRRDLTEAETAKAAQVELSFGASAWGGGEKPSMVVLKKPEKEAPGPYADRWNLPKRGEKAGRRDDLPAAADPKTKPKRGPKAGTKAAVEDALDGATE